MPQRGCSASQRAAAQARQTSTSSAPNAASRIASPDRRLLERCRALLASVVGLPGMTVVGAAVVPAGVETAGVEAAGGVADAGGVVDAGDVAAGAGTVEAVDPGATVPGCAPLGAGVLVVPLLVPVVLVWPCTRADGGIGIFIPRTVVVVAAEHVTGAIDARRNAGTRSTHASIVRAAKAAVPRAPKGNLPLMYV